MLLVPYMWASMTFLPNAKHTDLRFSKDTASGDTAGSLKIDGG